MIVTQTALTVVSQIVPSRLPDLKRLLFHLGNAVDKTPDFPIAQTRGLHFCSWTIANEISAAHEEPAPLLIFEANFDGPENEFIDELLRRVGPKMAEFYSACEGLGAQPSPDAVRAHLLQHRQFTNTFYVGLTDYTVERILREENLRQEIEQFLDVGQRNGNFAGRSPHEIRAAIQQHIQSSSKWSWAKDVPRIPWLVQYGQRLVRCLARALVIALVVLLIGWIALWFKVPGSAAIIGLLVLACALGIAIFVLRLRYLEEHDPQPDWLHLTWPQQEVFDRENRQPLNHLANVSPLKLGMVRAITIRAVLFIVHWAARFYYNQGELGGTATIHFARWVVINGGRDLLFLSNYDGSWESYLTDFVDRSSVGLTAIWSNTQEFPYARWLVLDGAAHEEDFKAAARRRQIPSLLWYSAYPQLTKANIQNNSAILADLFSELDPQAELAWLRRL